MRIYLITDNDGLWWNNDEGWTILEYATVFTEYEHKKFTAPLGGKWVEFIQTLRADTVEFAPANQDAATLAAALKREGETIESP